MEPVSECSCWQMFIETRPHSELKPRERAFKQFKSPVLNAFKLCPVRHSVCDVPQICDEKRTEEYSLMWCYVPVLIAQSSADNESSVSSRWINPVLSWKQKWVKNDAAVAFRCGFIYCVVMKILSQVLRVQWNGEFAALEWTGVFKLQQALWFTVGVE